MLPTYSVSIDPDRRLLLLTLAGFFDIETTKRFIAERDAAVRALNCGLNQHVTLCDISEQKVSKPEIAEYFGKAIADPRYASRRIAFVIATALERRQTQRVAQRDHVGYFGTLAEAEKWLFTEPGAASEI